MRKPTKSVKLTLELYERLVRHCEKTGATIGARLDLSVENFLNDEAPTLEHAMRRFPRHREVKEEA